MKKIIFFLCLISFSFSFSQSTDYFSYQNKDKWTYYISKNEIGNVFDGIKEEVRKYAKICTTNQYCLEVRQTNDDIIYIRLYEGLSRPGPKSGLVDKKDESEIFLLEYKKRFESRFSGVDYIDPTLILEIAFNNDPNTIERFADDRPNFIEDDSLFYLNEYFSNDNLKYYQVINKGRIYSVPFDELKQFLKAYPNAEVLKPLSDFLNLLKSNSSIQIKLSGMGMEDVLSFSLKGSSKALSIFSLN